MAATEKDRNGHGNNSLEFELTGGVNKKWAILSQASNDLRIDEEGATT
jgi:hypothetical protein